MMVRRSTRALTIACEKLLEVKLFPDSLLQAFTRVSSHRYNNNAFKSPAPT
jgi:hypothetical protein